MSTSRRVSRRACGGVAQLVELLVDVGVLLDVGVGAGNVGLRLVVVVVADEVLDGVLREELLELGRKLGGEGLVVGEHKGRALEPLDDARHRERLAAAGHAHEGLVVQTVLRPSNQAVDGVRLVACGPEVRNDLEVGHGPSSIACGSSGVRSNLGYVTNLIRFGHAASKFAGLGDPDHLPAVLIERGVVEVAVEVDDLDSRIAQGGGVSRCGGRTGFGSRGRIFCPRSRFRRSRLR